jgi:CubicO group peptidase (beta-lactamase class C family)
LIHEAGMDAEALSRLGGPVRADIDAGRHFGASLLVARAGKVVYREDLGTVAPGRAAAAGDRYMLMSMSKAYTAVLALRAIEAGQFALETRVADLMPDFAVGGKAAATVYQLLNHTAGLPTAPVAAPLPLTAAGQLARHAKAINALKAMYKPGTRCAYTSGTGYDALGQILVLTDPKRRSFRQIAHEELFAPLGMTHTSFGCATDDPRRVPVSFTEANMTPASPTFMHVFNDCIGSDAEYPCAGAFSDIDDVYRFTEALSGRGPAGFEVLSPEMFALARQNTTGAMPLEALPTKGLPAIRQMIATMGLKTFIASAKYARASARPDFDPYPAHFTLLGGYVRGDGDIFNPAGRTASPSALTAVGGGSTGWLIDTERDLTFIFLSAGLIEGFAHPQRLERLNDLAIAAVID